MAKNHCSDELAASGLSGSWCDAMTHPPVTVYRTPEGLLAQRGEDCFRLAGGDLDTLFGQDDPARWLWEQLVHAVPVLRPDELLAPIQSQEVWAAGVTYLRSRDARIEESKDSGGGSFYDRVYDAERPEIFFKATPHRVVGPGGPLTLRSDSKWNVPEPELTLALSRQGRIFGYTIGNDLSSRDIEGENPLYLPQAKVWSACCALGPGLVVREPLPRETTIEIEISRGGATVFRGATALDQMKRTLPELAGFLFRDNAFPHGCYLLTGTGTVPPNDFTLASGDNMSIAIAGLGTLQNRIA
ncbi:MAG: 2-dehydro-3-deoxy-D-arabinonate dehydratase [Chthoniobacter sp.]|jgi:2-dehydro-3-deoxy-D-arabinonate dehydratase|nr:2-dehydro-3-deoxy-D-arabinonate dehydratase [Chthoniobacter sp.]